MGGEHVTRNQPAHLAPQYCRGQVVTGGITQRYSRTATGQFTLTIGKGRQKRDIVLATTDATKYVKGDDEARFDELLVEGATVDVELSDGTATTVKTAK